MPVHFLNDGSIDSVVGGKAGNLMLLADTFLVPTGFVITPDEELDEQMLLNAFEKLDSSKVAVRSSAINEDGKDAAWAGQLETYLNVPLDGLLDAVRLCRESGESERAKSYAQQQGVTAGGVAVLVQQMVSPDVSGVAFSRHPVTSVKAIVIEVVKGLADALVSGEVTPDTYVIRDRRIEAHLASDTQLATDTQLYEIAGTVAQIEAKIGYPVDVEWAIQDDQLYILQARPITAL